MLDDKIKEVIDYIARCAESESVWLSPHPAWNVEVTGLLDAITSIYGVEKSDVADVFNPVREEVETKQKSEDWGETEEDLPTKKEDLKAAKKKKRTAELKKLFEKP